MTVHVDSGAVVGGVNITLVARDSFVVSGVVVRQGDGTPLAGTSVLLRNKESESGGALVPGMNQRSTRTDAEGRWSFSNVAEGSYVVMALAPPTRSMHSEEEPADREEAYRQSRQRFLVAQQDVIVAGGNLNDLLLSISGSGSITGVVELESGQALPQGLVIFLELLREGGLPGLPLPVRVQPDGSFNFNEVQGGEFYLSAAMPQGSTFFVKAVTANERDLRRVPLKLAEGTVAGPIRIILSTELGRLTGRVLSDKNQPAGDLIVLLAPAESEKQQFRTSYFTTRTAADGAYSLVIAPGDYLVFARRRDQLPGIMSDEFIRNEAGKAIRVTVAAGEQKRLELSAP
ncbi:MAG TPA: carboxypeptidase-like regulatory domain-containing protein, partial [Pyrinomonadaceae bacterium]|nr:carboxypeptidase-like regulatory domain-containing protein [Pyrinomonadaceae bacterium]